MTRELQRKQAPATQPFQASALGHARAAHHAHPASGFIGHNFGNLSVLSPDLKVGPPNDAFEQEADRVASQIGAASRAPAAVNLADSSPRARRLCQSCNEAEEDKGGLASPAALAQGYDIGGTGVNASGGQGLGSGVRAVMEPYFGFNFGNVRIHADEHSASLARNLSARAFTVGQDVFFGRGEYQPHSPSGRHLLAHELTHVVQQSHAGAGGPVREATGPRIQRYLSGPPQLITATPTTPATWGQCRNFNEVVSWAAPGLRNGFILQECINGDAITTCDGANVPAPNTPHYWEAWQVDATGAISDGNSDTWFRGGRPSTTGSWTFDSNVFAVGGPLKPTWGFARGAVGTAGGLLSTTTGPSHDELIQPSLVRHRGGQWDCCNGKNTHVPI